jgi:hypothetical protein
VRDALVALLVGTPFLVGASVADDPDGHVVLRFQDPAIVESSGIVVRNGLVLTINDSGDSARVFAVDLGSGRTVGTTTWDAEPLDVEAIAPAGPGEAWVADIGDNSGDRPSVEVTRVPVGRSDLAVAGDAYELVYPDGPHDAEALLRHPDTGRLYVVTKGVLGGIVFEAPENLSSESPNRLRAIGDAPGVVTDGAFFPDGKHLVLRNYTTAFVLTFPGLERVGSFELPPQQQGEGIAVAADGRVYLSSEGVRSPLLRVPLPGRIHDVVLPDRRPDGGQGVAVDEGPLRRDPWQWLLGGALGVAAIAVLLRSVRPR